MSQGVSHRSTQGVSEADEYEAALLEMLLQRHRIALTGAAVRTTLGRLIGVTLATWTGATSSLSYTQGITTAVVATFFCVVWFADGERQSIQLARLEEVLSRRTGGRAEDLYIESRSLRYEASAQWTAGPFVRSVIRLEPLLWLYMIVAIVLVKLFI